MHEIDQFLTFMHVVGLIQLFLHLQSNNNNKKKEKQIRADKESSYRQIRMPSAKLSIHFKRRNIILLKLHKKGLIVTQIWVL